MGNRIFLNRQLGINGLHQNCNANGVRTVTFTISKSVVVKITMFPQRNLHTYVYLDLLSRED
jgi:diphthamide biosynthesis methyltransferase